jgi:hypothetical protein
MHFPALELVKGPVPDPSNSPQHPSKPFDPQPKFTIISPHDFGSKAELARPQTLTTCIFNKIRAFRA